MFEKVSQYLVAIFTITLSIQPTLFYIFIWNLGKVKFFLDMSNEPIEEIILLSYLELDWEN